LYPSEGQVADSFDADTGEEVDEAEEDVDSQEREEGGLHGQAQ